VVEDRGASSSRWGKTGGGLFRQSAAACFRRVTDSVDRVRSITRDEAAERAELLGVDGYQVALDLTGDGPTFTSRTRIRFRCADPRRGSWVDVKPHRLTRVTLNGTPVPVETMAGGRLPLTGLAESNELVVEAQMAYSHDGEGLHRHVDPADGNVYLYAMSFLDAAPRWFACFDQPDLKAPYRFEVRCPDGWTVAGNAPATRGADGSWLLEQARPLSTYFTTLIAGPYHSIRTEHDGIALVLHARASLAEHLDRDAAELAQITADCLDEFHRLFGVRYPWGEYHQAFVPEFNAGAMENPGCVTFRDPLVFRSRATDAEHAVRASTIAHEMAHMWFGDLVTMRWWDDLWLNESFAEYLGHRVCDAVTRHRSWVEFGIVRKAWGYTADRRPSTHPVAGNGAADAATALSDFDGISYAKGAAVLRQLGAYLGEDVFLTGLRRYFADHAFGNASLADLLAAWTAAGAADLPAWTEQWLQSSGLDTLRAEHVDGTVTVHCEPPPGTHALRRHAVTVAAFDAAGRQVAQQPALLAGPSTSVPLGRSEQLVIADSLDETWAKIAFDDAAWRALPAAVGGLDPLPRVVVCNAMRLAVADAELAPQAALEVALAVLAIDPSDAVVGVLARWLSEVLIGRYLPPAECDAAAERLAVLLLDVATAAVPGSGLQLAAVRGYVRACADSDRLRGWLAGAAVPDGVVIDTELRWEVVRRLATLGALDVAQLDAEAAADRSTQGAVHAAACRALRPDAEAKHAAWQTIMADAGCPNYELYAIANAFWQPSQRELTAPYVERYFAEIADLAAIRSGWVLARVSEYAYPQTAADPHTVELTEALLARDDLDPGVRRSVLDAGDDLRRVVASRQKFG
jgi:aminopeptidase N